jgi:hypothetical protein
VPNPTAAIIAQASTSQLKDYLLGFTEEAAILAVRELINRGERAEDVIQALEAELQPSLDNGMPMRSCLELIAALKREFLSGNAPAETYAKG